MQGSLPFEVNFFDSDIQKGKKAKLWISILLLAMSISLDTKFGGCSFNSLSETAAHTDRRRDAQTDRARSTLRQRIDNFLDNK